MLYIRIHCLTGRVVVSATAGQGVSGSIPGSGKVLLVFFRYFENILVVARSLESCPVYCNRLKYPLLHETYNITYIVMCNTAYPVGDKRRDVAPATVNDCLGSRNETNQKMLLEEKKKENDSFHFSRKPARHDHLAWSEDPPFLRALYSVFPKQHWWNRTQLSYDFYIERCVLWMHAMHDLPTIDILHTRAANHHRNITSRVACGHPGHIRKMNINLKMSLAMLRCCECVWLQPIIFIDTRSVTLVETDSTKTCFLYGMMRAMDHNAGDSRTVVKVNLANSVEEFAATVTEQMELAAPPWRRNNLICGNFDEVPRCRRRGLWVVGKKLRALQN
ncbi:hypothetical protein SFRURICE_008363 [Spodoptera frugiperda]|nr:hypothetical protein SFRURICE_008363 [Spodoptera frugiperda]